MNAQTETFEEEYEEYDEFDEEDDGERGLSGLVVLLMGIVMLGAFASVVWIAYQQGVKTADARGGAPYVAADPEPLKIENNATAATDDPERSVYDRLDGEATDQVETLAAAPEEPVTRTSDDPIAAIASNNGTAEEGAGVVDDAVADRIATLAAADDELAEEPAATPAPTPRATTPTQAASTQTTEPLPAASQPALPAAPSPVEAGDALSGTHLVQVGAFGSQNEADTNFSRMQTKFGELFSGKGSDVERADLGAKGVFFRLRIGPFASSADAKTFCEGLKSRGQDCLVKSK